LFSPFTARFQDNASLFQALPLVLSHGFRNPSIIEEGGVHIGKSKSIDSVVIPFNPAHVTKYPSHADPHAEWGDAWEEKPG
jgi:hypothetical protein